MLHYFQTKNKSLKIQDLLLPPYPSGQYLYCRKRAWYEIELAVTSENISKPPSSPSKQNTRAFNFLIDKLRSRVANWKASALSIAGRLTLISTVTTVIPTHIMLNTMLPSKVCKEIDKINKNFLWGDSTTKRRIHLLNWKPVTLPKAAGGLGIEISIHRNKTRLAKRLWDVRTHLDSLHALMFKKKYSHPALSKRTSPTWASLCQAKSICDSGSRWLLHNGSSTRF